MRFAPALLLTVTSTLAYAGPYVSESGFLKLSSTEFRLDDVRASCPEHKLTVPHAERRWKVAKFSEVATSSGKTYYQLLCRGTNAKKGTPKASTPLDNVAAFFFVSGSDSATVHLVWAETAEVFGAEWFEAASAKKDNFGNELVLLPNPSGGNAGFNRDVLFLLTADGPQKIDTSAWKQEVRSQLPKGLMLWNDLIPNLSEMTFASPLWRDGKDDHASPSGGSLHGSLAVENGKLAVKSVKVETAQQ